MKPITNAWALREVYFDDNGEPIMYREPEHEHAPVAYIYREGKWSKTPLYTVYSVEENT